MNNVYSRDKIANGKTEWRCHLDKPKTP